VSVTTTFLVGTDGESTSEALADYLEDRVVDGDTVSAVNSLYGGDRTDDEEVRDGKAALEVLEDRVGADAHQLIRGNSPQEDLLEFAADRDVDEFVIGIRKRSPTGKMLFGSTAQDLLLETPLPTVTVPLVD
jgi:nucleotide-binding universal stress UspA family protein